MNHTTAEFALQVLADWAQERPEMHVAMARSPKHRTIDDAVVKQVLPASRKVLLTINDELGQGVALTASLEGAAWEYAPEGGVVAEFADVKWRRYLVARFANGALYVFGERAAE